MGYELFDGVQRGGVYLVTVYVGMLLVIGGRVAVQYTQRKWKATLFAAIFAFVIGYYVYGIQSGLTEDPMYEGDECAIAKSTALGIYWFACMLTGILRPEPIHIRLGPGEISRK